MRCSNTCVNDDGCVKQVFGFNKINERFKLCIKCRERNKHNRDQPHRQEQQKVYYKSRAEENKEHSKQQYLKNRDEYLKKVQCELCGKSVCGGQMKRHQHGKWCNEM